MTQIAIVLFIRFFNVLKSTPFHFKPVLKIGHGVFVSLKKLRDGIVVAIVNRQNKQRVKGHVYSPAQAAKIGLINSFWISSSNASSPKSSLNSFLSSA